MRGVAAVACEVGLAAVAFEVGVTCVPTRPRLPRSWAWVSCGCDKCVVRIVPGVLVSVVAYVVGTVRCILVVQLASLGLSAEMALSVHVHRDLSNVGLGRAASVRRTSPTRGDCSCRGTGADRRAVRRAFRDEPEAPDDRPDPADDDKTKHELCDAQADEVAFKVLLSGRDEHPGSGTEYVDDPHNERVPLGHDRHATAHGDTR
jgi:hypothetical protein